MAERDKIAARPSRLWKVILVCSLALNLAVAGMVIGSMASGRFGDGPPRSFDLGIGPIARALSPQERRDVGRSLRQDRVLRDVDLRGRVNGMVDALKAEPFVPEALRGFLDAQNAQMSNVQSKAQDALLDTIVQMSSARRQEFADQLQQELSKARPRSRRPSGG